MDSPLQIYDLRTPAILAEAADYGVGRFHPFIGHKGP